MITLSRPCIFKNYQSAHVSDRWRKYYEHCDSLRASHTSLSHKHPTLQPGQLHKSHEALRQLHCTADFRWCCITFCMQSIIVKFHTKNNLHFYHSFHKQILYNNKFFQILCKLLVFIFQKEFNFCRFWNLVVLPPCLIQFQQNVIKLQWL
jgi:hypothetical protein